MERLNLGYAIGIVGIFDLVSNRKILTFGIMLKLYVLFLYLYKESKLYCVEIVENFRGFNLGSYFSVF